MNDPRTDAQRERNWWSSLEGQDLDDNLHGIPPYDIDKSSWRIRDLIGPHSRVLDLGCGRGRLTNHLARQFPDCTFDGVDVSLPALELATMSAEPNAHFWHGDGRNLPKQMSPGFSYDLAYSVTMFQHIPDEAKWGYIRQVHDLLASTGRFIFTISIGSEPHTFLNHQTPSLEQFCMELVTFGFDAVGTDPTPDENGWTWILGCRT